MIATRSSIAAAVRAAIRSSSLNSRFAKTLTGGVAVALSLGFTASVHAQTAPSASTNPNAPAILEEVTVTGSRIKRTNDFTTPTPTTVIDDTTMQSMGVVNVGEALKEVPSNISQFTPTNTGNSSFFTGAYIPDLRGLNPFFGTRTLTLINTRRVVQSTQGDSFDLNFLPQILVQRIDTVTGGASAAYGSGAVSGVINVILDNKLEGGKFNADMYETSHSDGKDRHVAAAYGHGLFDDRVHFVLGGEYENQDGVGCINARTWCAQNVNFYQTGTAPTGPTAPPGTAVATYSLGSNLRNNIISTTGAFFPPSAIAGSGAGTLQATPDGTGVVAYNTGVTPYGAATNASTVVGGDGNPVNKFTNLLAPNKRGVLTGMVTAKLTDSINFSADVNWGKVESSTSVFGNTDQPTVFIIPGVFNIITNNITAQNAYINQAANLGNPSLLNAVNKGYASLNKDWTSQIPLFIDTSTTVKRFSAGLDGKFGDSSWTWDAYAEYGLTEREQLEPNEKRAASYSMALDSVLVNGQPECRVTAAGGVANVADPTNPYFNPGASYTAPFTLATNSLLAQGCVPLNPFGTAPVSAGAEAYSFGNLDEQLRYEQTVVALNATGNFYDGIGAGPFGLAAGFEWRQEVGHNDEIAVCLPGDSAATCSARAQDFAAQFGTAFGGIVTVDEAYLEASLPLLKDVPGAKSLALDLAARESRYENKALYGLDVQNGVQPKGTHNLTTWKVTLDYQPIDSIRLRGTQSRDSRAANFRELYYGQVLQSGATGGFGYCSHLSSANPFADPCTINLLGNVDLKPEISDTTTLGIVLTPSWAQGLQFSADWFHIKIKDAIEQANAQEVELSCQNGNAQACSQMQFNTPGGAADWQAGIDNASLINATSFNGAFYETRGVDFSLNYLMSLPDGSTLSTRMLTTWTGLQQYQNYPGGPVFNILGQTGAGAILSDNGPAARWRGNMSITWAKGVLSLTPSVNWVGQGTLNYAGVTPDQADLYQKVANNDPSIRGYGYILLPFNHVPSYFLFNMNATLNFEDMAGLKSVQLFAQVNNVLNKKPPFAATPVFFGNAYAGTNPVYFDTLGLATRIGFRINF
jgi:iron complex outermembrane recepter protein